MGDEDSDTVIVTGNVSIEDRPRIAKEGRCSTIKRMYANLSDKNSTVMKWTFRILWTWLVVALILDMTQLILIHSYWNMRIYKQLEEFNRDTAKISSMQGGYNQHEFDLKNLKKIDEAVDIVFWLACSLALILSGILWCAGFQSLFRDRAKKLICLLLSLIFFFITFASEILLGWMFIVAMGKTNEAEVEVSTLFSSAFSKNPAGFKEIERIFSCRGYTMKKQTMNAKDLDRFNNGVKKYYKKIIMSTISHHYIISALLSSFILVYTKTCTQNVQEIILQLANSPIKVVLGLFIVINIMCLLTSVVVAYFAYRKKRSKDRKNKIVDPSIENRFRLQESEPPTANEHWRDGEAWLLEETLSRSRVENNLGSPGNERIDDCGSKHVVVVELHDMNGNGANINHDQDENDRR